MKKKFCVSLMLIFISLMSIVFSACCQVDACVIQYDDGTIQQCITVTLDEYEIETAGADVDAIKTDILTTAINKLNSIKQNYDNKLNAALGVVDGETREDLLTLQNGLKIVGNEDWYDNQLSVGIEFVDINAFKFYYNITEETTTEYQYETKLLYTKVYYYANNIYAGKCSALYQEMKTEFSTKYPLFVDSESNKLTYTYETASRREHSDADTIVKYGSYYYHTWNIEIGHENEPIMIYYRIANSGTWIMGCVMLALAVTLILLFIALIKVIAYNKKYRKR